MAQFKPSYVSEKAQFIPAFGGVPSWSYKIYGISPSKVCGIEKPTKVIGI